MLDTGTFSRFVEIAQWFFLFYFIALNGTYLALTLVSLAVLPRYIQKQSIHKLPSPQTGFEPPISIIAAAYNEEAVIASSVKALLQLEYDEYEITVVNDGSKDNTLQVLIDEFEMEIFPAAFRRRLKHADIRNIYQSKKYPRLRVIDKENGGKSDALNAGINGARYGYFMPIDADTILDRKCLTYMVQPFLLNPDTVGVGGTVRLANGCAVKDGIVTEIGLPKTWLGLFQVLEYFRAFLSGRVGWSYFDGLPLISGAFGMFSREAVIAVGGYSHKTICEDLDLVLRIHRHFRLEKKPYRIDFVADPTCWTEAPENFKVLRKQRVRWQRGLFEAVWDNRKLLFHPRGGFVSWFSVPFLVFLEGISPLIELGGLILFIVCLFFGITDSYAVLIFLLLSVSTGYVTTIITVLIEELAFRTYPEKRHLLMIFLGALVENFGYRQITSIWRLEGTLKWIFRTKATWGAMTRTASWKVPEPEKKLPSLSALQNQKTELASKKIISETASTTSSAKV